MIYLSNVMIYALHIAGVLQDISVHIYPRIIEVENTGKTKSITVGMYLDIDQVSDTVKEQVLSILKEHDIDTGCRP